MKSQNFIPKESILKKEYYIYQCSSVYEAKNQTLLLEAFAEAKNQAPDINLVFVGDGELRSELEKKIEILGIERECFFLQGMFIM